eukprot:494933-Amphidinium_carterae.1
MGWKLAVDLTQEVHETIIGHAGLHEPFVNLQRLIPLGRPFPSRLQSCGSSFHSVYVDNWDQFQIASRSWSSLYLLVLPWGSMLFVKRTLLLALCAMFANQLR